MKQRKIGNTAVGAIGLGCMGMSHAYGTSDEKENLNVLDRAITLGCNFWDTADFYGMGKNEELLGKSLKKHRNKVFLATKVGLSIHHEHGLSIITNNKPEYIKACIDRSLQRLGIDHVDMYYLHRIDPTIPIEESVGAMAELVAAGKVRFLGLSEATAEQITAAVKTHPITALQTEYSLWTRDIEDGILALCQQQGITVIPYAPLGRGFLTGAITTSNKLAADDARRSIPRFDQENIAKNLAIVKQLEIIAQKQGATTAQIALAWILARNDWMIPIPGTRHIKYLEDNVAAANLHLARAELQQLENINAAGSRFPDYQRVKEIKFDLDK